MAILGKGDGAHMEGCPEQTGKERRDEGDSQTEGATTAGIASAIIRRTHIHRIHHIHTYLCRNPCHKMLTEENGMQTGKMRHAAQYSVASCPCCMGRCPMCVWGRHNSLCSVTFMAAVTGRSQLFIPSKWSIERASHKVKNKLQRINVRKIDSQNKLNENYDEN